MPILAEKETAVKRLRSYDGGALAGFKACVLETEIHSTGILVAHPLLAFWFMRAFWPAIAVLVSSTLWLPSAAAREAALSYPPVVQQYTDADGQPLSGVSSLLQTRDGYLWIGTFGGLERFDGETFTRFGARKGAPGISGAPVRSRGPLSNRITTLLEDSQDRLWVGTQDGGLSVLENGDFLQLDTCEQTCQINALIEHESAVWAASDTGVWRIDMHSLHSEPAADVIANVSGLTFNDNGAMFVAIEAQFARLDAGAYYYPPAPDQLQGVVDVLADGDDLLVTSDADLYRYTPVTGHWKAQGIGAIHSLRRQRDGSILVTTSADRVVQLWHDDRHDQLLELPTASLRQAEMDNEGNLWLGSASRGLFRARAPWIGTLSDIDLDQSAAGRAIAPDGHGGFWFALGCSGVRHWQADGTWVDWREHTELQSACVETMTASSGGSLWFGSANGHLLRLRPEKDTQVQIVMQWPGQLPVRAILEREDGRLLVSVHRSTFVLTLDAQDEILDVQPIAALDELVIRQIVPARQGGHWFVGDHGVLRVLDNAIVERWTEREGLSSRFARALYEEPDGALWIGTYGAGLNHIKHGTVRTYTRDNGLADNTISCILPDDSGRLWLAGDRGVSLLLPDSETPTSIRSLSFGKNDGLNPAEINGGNQNSCMVDPQGRFWLALVAGFAMLEPDQYEPPPPRSPPVHIERIAVDGLAHPPGKSLRLSTAARNIEIRYTATHFSTPERLRFRFRLSGADSSWVDAGTNRSVIFPSLPWGRHTFQVQARLESDVWPTTWRELHIDNPAPWYQRPWIWLTSTLLALVLLLDGTWQRQRSPPNLTPSA